MLHAQDLLENRVDNLKDLVRQLKSAKCPKKSFGKITARIHAMPTIGEEEELHVEVSTIAPKEMKEEESDQFQSEKVYIMFESNMRIISVMLKL